jgi:hypothetical protein
MELQKFIKQKLGIQEDSEPDKALEILAEKKEELENAIMQIGLLETQIRKNCFQKWEKWLKKDFPNYEIVSTWNNPKEYYPQVGLKLSIKGKETIAAIECENNDCYYGCFPHKATNTTKHPKIQNELEKLYPDVDWESNDSWYIYKHTSLQDVYGCLKTLIEEIIEKMG